MKLSFLPRLYYADNTTLNTGTGGDIIASDDISGVKFQRNKLIYGDNGTNDGDVSGTNPFPITPSLQSFPAGFIRTTDEPHQQFYDPFDSTLDTTISWTATNGNSGVLASNSSGVMSMGTGTTANGYSKLTTKMSFKPNVPSWIGYSFLNIFPDLASPTANSFRFWGAGTTPGTPTTTAPLTDAIGFEITTGGKMHAVVYAGGTRTSIQDLSAATGNSKQPTDASGHRYIIYIRTDKIFFYIDGLAPANLVATSNFNYPNVQTLPMLMLAVGHSTPPGSNTQIQSVGATVWDTGKNSVGIMDRERPYATLILYWDLSNSSALEASRVIKASAGWLRCIDGFNSKTSSQYIQLFNSTSVPANSTAPNYAPVLVPAMSNFSIDFGPEGLYLNTGISISNSSTAATKTVGSADCWFSAKYR